MGTTTVQQKCPHEENDPLHLSVHNDFEA
jgi:hypothetical protein